MKKILSIIIAIVLASCGASKKTKTEAVEERKIVSTELMIDSSIVKTNIARNTVTEENTIEGEIKIAPLDTSKPMDVGGKKYKNAVLSIKNKEINKVTTNRDSIVSDSTGTSSGRSVTVDVGKKTINITDNETKEPIQFYLYVFLFILLLLLLYWARERIKKAIS